MNSARIDKPSLLTKINSQAYQVGIQESTSKAYQLGIYKLLANQVHSKIHVTIFLDFKITVIFFRKN